MPDLDPRLLATLRAVIDAGTISSAARALHLSQPAVTAQVRMLEEQCGRALFIRSARGVSPTSAAHALAVYADRMAALLTEASDALALKPGALGGSLLVGASTTIASYVLPTILAQFLRRVPLARVRVEVGNTDQILALVKSNTVPLGFVEGLRRASQVRLTPFLDDELVPVVSTTAPPALRNIRDVDDLAGAPILWRERGSGTRAVVERALRRAIGTRSRAAGELEIGGTEAIKGAAIAGIGVAFLSRWSIRREIAAGQLRIVRIAGLTIDRSFSFAQPTGATTGVTEAFHRFAVSIAGDLTP